uniref:Lysosomal-associated transmembrane protein 4A n=1 Tax=Acrobeloides nanus TaxID=290746 RepID=A0A914CEH8_9BILA
MDVLTSAKNIAELGTGFWICVLIIGFFSGAVLVNEHKNPTVFLCKWFTMMIFFIVCIIIDILVSYGIKLNKPWALLPYIVLNGIELVLLYILSILLIICGIFSPPNKEYPSPVNEMTAKKYPEYPKIVVLMLSFGLFMTNIVLNWFWYMIFLAYKYVKYEAKINIISPYDEIKALKDEDDPRLRIPSAPALT